MSKESAEIEKRAYQLAIPVGFELHHHQNYEKFSKLDERIRKIMRKIYSKSISRAVGEYDKNTCLFYAVSSHEHAEKTKQKIIRKGLVKKVYIDEI